MKRTSGYILLELIIFILLLPCSVFSGNWLRLGVSNDIVFQTDRNFSNGIGFEYITSGEISFFRPLHFMQMPDQPAFHCISVRQNIYTPDDLRAGIQNETDRPFASYLIIGSELTTLHTASAYLFTSKMEIGILGKYARGNFIQNGIHDILPTSAHVYGWENQVRSDLVANYGVSMEKVLYGNDFLGASGHIEAELGIPYTQAAMGVTLWAGAYKTYFSNLDLSIQNDWRIYFFTSFRTNLVLYNATIQGGLINKMKAGTYPDIMPLVFRAKTGLTLVFPSMNLELGVQHNSPEFRNGSAHRWGYLSFTFNIGH